MIRKSILAVMLAVSGVSAHAALSAGDIAFTGFNADKDYWSVVALTDIAANTNIYFSDNEWNGSSFIDANEHTLRWNTGANSINAGTVVLFTEIDNNNPTPDVITASVGTLALAGSGGANLGLSASGDTLYAYIGGATAPTTFLTAITSNASATEITNTGLTVGTNAVKIIASADFGEYTGARSGATTFATYAQSINNSSNWLAYADGDRSALIPSISAFSVTAVPEPQTYAMLLAGLGLMGLIASRRSVR